MTLVPLRAAARWLAVLVALVGSTAFAATTPPPGAPPATPPTTAAPAPATSTAPAMTAQQRALASPVPVWRRDGLLVEQGGRALYVFENDVPGESRCDSKCTALWPPHYAAPDAKPHGPFTLARDPEGRAIWAFRGRPLYRWISDRKRGAAGGDGVADVWFLVRVPKALESEVTPYFPMPMPRPGRPTAPAPAPSQETKR